MCCVPGANAVTPSHIPLPPPHQVRLEKQDPEAFLKKHPYKGEGACPFRASAYKSRTQAKGAWIFARKTSVLDHAASCTARGKIKARQLLNHPSFCQSVTDAKASVAGAGKVTMKALVNTSQQMGFGEARLSQNTIYYMARRLSETADPNLKTTPKTKPSPNPAGKTPRSAPNRGGGASVVEAAAAAVGVGKRNRSCARCQVAGRTGEEVYRHKGSNCPFEVDLDSIRIPADPEMTARGTPPTPATAAIPLAPTVVGTTAPAPAPAPAPPPTVSIAPAPAPTPMAE